MTITADITTPTVTLPTDHEVSPATAADVLGVHTSTIARYLRSGRLNPLGVGISANSVSRYMHTRDANNTRTRYRKIARTPLDIAADMYDRAVAMEAQARAIKKLYKDVLEEAGDGVHGGWVIGHNPGRQIDDSKAIKADFAARGLDIPKTTSNPSLYVRRIAA